MPRIPDDILKAIKDARAAATLQNELDTFVKDNILKYNSTRIIAPLDRVIEWANSPRKFRYDHGAHRKNKSAIFRDALDFDDVADALRQQRDRKKP